MSVSKEFTEDAVRAALPEAMRNGEAINEHWLDAITEYAVAWREGDDITITPEEQTSRAMTTASMALTADFIDTMTGRRNGLAPLTAFTDVIDYLPKQTSEAVTAVPRGEQVQWAQDLSNRSGKTSRLLSAVMACEAVLTDASRGERARSGIVLVISAMLELEPETKLKFTIGRRTQASLKEGVTRIAGEQGLEAARTLVQTTLLAADSIMQLSTFGAHFANLEFEIPNQRSVLKSPAINRAFTACRLQEDRLVLQFLKSGYVNPSDLSKHRSDLTALTHRLTTTQGIPAGSAYVQRINASLTNNLVEERKTAHAAAHTLLGFKTPEEYDNFLQQLYQGDMREADRRLKEFTQTHEPEAEQQEEPVAEALPVAVTVEQAATHENTERIAELRIQYEDLMNLLATVRQPYQPSNTLLKSSGLRDLQYELRHGLNDADRGLQLGGVSHDMAQSITQMLYGLGLRYDEGGGEAFRADVAHDLGNEMQLTAMMQAVRSELNTMGQNGLAVSANELCGIFEWLGANKAAMQAIIEARLTDRASFYTAMLEELLDMSDRSFAAEPTAESESTSKPEEPVRVEDGLDVFIPLRETDVAEQLDWEVFPPEVTLSDIQKLTEGKFRESDAANIDWARIADLLQISRAYDGNLYRAKPQSLGAAEPYFVVEADIHGKTFAIAENPQYGNATYILRTDRAYDGASWKEVLEQSRQFARLLGAERIVHSDQRAHLERIMSNIQSQLLVKV